VIYGLSDFSYSCQGFAHLFAVYKKKGRLEGLKLAYVGDGNDVAHSLLYDCSKIGMNITLGCQKGYEPGPKVVSQAKEKAKGMGCEVKAVQDPIEAAKGADVIYTDVWTSMGKEKEWQERGKLRKPYQVNPLLTKGAKEDPIFIDCLRAHRGEEVTNEVADSKNSVIFDKQKTGYIRKKRFWR